MISSDTSELRLGVNGWLDATKQPARPRGDRAIDPYQRSRGPARFCARVTDCHFQLKLFGFTASSLASLLVTRLELLSALTISGGDVDLIAAFDASSFIGPSLGRCFEGRTPPR